MSAKERSEIRAFQELELLVRNLGEELATFRRRALLAESQLKEQGGADAKTAAGPLADRLAELESENAKLRERLSNSEQKVREMLDRVRFLRQQMQAPVGAGRA